MRLFQKILLAMLGVTTSVLAIYALVSRVSLGGGFEDFLDQQELSRVEEHLVEIGDLYDSEDGWQSVRQRPRQLHRIFDSELGRPPERRGRAPGSGRGPGRGPGPGGGPRGRPPPESAPRLEFAVRVYLLDANRDVVLGRPPTKGRGSDVLPITRDEQIVGWAGVVPPQGALTQVQQDFLDQQQDILIWTFVGSLLIAALLAWFISSQFANSIGAVVQTVKALARGDFDSRTEVPGRDEIAKLGGDVNQLAEMLAANESARRRWTADVAHELRTPLSILRGELEALEDGLRKPDAAALASLLAETKLLERLVEDLHQLTMADAGSLNYRMEVVDLREHVSDAVRNFHKRAARAGLSLEHTLPSDAVMIDADPTRLQQLLENLLENSVRYTDSGGRVSIVVQADGRLSVKDSAPGVPSDSIAQLFDRFYRVEVSRNRDSGGSGLGLAICRRIAQGHGASIQAMPSSLGGLDVTVAFPLAKSSGV